MKTLMAVAAATLMGGAALAADGAAEPANYWAVHLGQNTLDDWDARIDFGSGTPFTGQAKLDRGWHGGLMAGRRSEHARYEVEYQAGSVKFERLTLGELSADSNARGRYQALFANIYRTDQLTDTIGAFAGGGIGWGRVKLPLLGVGSTCACFGPAENDGFAWQLRAGLSYTVSPQASVTLQYTHLDLPRPKSGGAPAIAYEQRRFGAVTLGYLRRF